MAETDQNRPNRLKWTEWARLDQMDEIGLKWTKLDGTDQGGAKRTVLTEVNQMDWIRLKSTEVDWSRPNRTK